MIRIRLIDGTEKEIPRGHAREVIKPTALLRSAQLKAPYSALFLYQSELKPLLGPVPDEFAPGQWLLVCEKEAFVIQDLPTFLESEEAHNHADASEDSALAA